MKVPVFKIADLFSGAGGMSLGFQAAGFEIVMAIDGWDAAIKCYERNFPGHEVLKHDIADTDAIVEILRGKKLDVIIGGPPCQDFSTAGKKIEGKRASLTKCFAKIVALVQPACFVMENVQNAQRSRAFASARRTFKKAGYGITEIVLDASYCGVPQRRKRFFCIGILKGKDGMLAPLLQSRQSDLPTTVRDCLGNRLKYYYSHPRTYRRRAVFSIDEPAPTIRSGGNRPVPPDYRRHQSDPVDPIATGIRALTMKERAAIQMFPKDFKWGTSRIDNELLISNAVPMGLAQFVGKALYDFILNPAVPLAPCFLNWLCEEKNYSEEMARKILARYRRAGRLSGRPYRSDQQLLKELSRNVSYNALSSTVRDSIGCACKLHMEFTRQGTINHGE